MNTSVVLIVVSAPILLLILEVILAWLISGCGLDFNWPLGIFALLWWMAIIGFCAASGYMSIPEGEPLRVEWIVFCMVAGLHVFVRLMNDEPVFEFDCRPSTSRRLTVQPSPNQLPRSLISAHHQEGTKELRKERSQ